MYYFIFHIFWITYVWINIVRYIWYQSLIFLILAIG
jgi:hypothetical protein